MNILRLSTLSLTLAIAVFALSYNPSFADKPDNDKHDHGGGDDPATVFSVEMQPGDVGAADGLVISDGVACGTAEGTGPGELDVSFPASIAEGCVTVTDVFFITGPTGGPLTLRAFALDARVNKSDMLIFFTDGEIMGNTNTGDVYVSERLPVTISRNGSIITVEVNLSGQELRKANKPTKGDLVGTIAIGEIVYTPTSP